MPDRMRVYVSGPLSSSGDRAENVANAIAAGRQLVEAGYSVYVPHLSDKLDHDDSLGHATWIEHDLPWVDVCDAVLRLPGVSRGADEEVFHAKRLGIPIYSSVSGIVANPPIRRNRGGANSICPTPSIKDGGQREQFATGSVRDKRAGKGRYDLIPPIPLRRLANHYEGGAEVFGERNWELGQPCHCLLDSAMRHLQDYLAGDTSEDHLSAAAWNVFGLIHTEHKALAGELPRELLDLPRHKTQATEKTT